MTTEIGFIGVGTMGLPMATNLTRKGQRVVAYDVSAAAMAAAAAVPGIRTVASPAAVAAASDVLFTCLPNDTIVREAYLGRDGVREGGRRGLVTCDCSTVSPDATLAVHAGLASHGISHMDTPMLGSLPQAISGEVFFIVGGDPANLPRIRPALGAMGKLHVHVGPVATGNRIKLIHNGLAAVISVATAEALATCVQTGVDPEVLYAVVCQGGGMACGTYWERRAKRIMDGEFSPTFMLQHMLKDATLALEHARGAGVPAPLLEETRRTYAEALADGWATQDFSAVSHVIEKRIGRPLSAK